MVGITPTILYKHFVGDDMLEMETKEEWIERILNDPMYSQTREYTREFTCEESNKLGILIDIMDIRVYDLTMGLKPVDHVETVKHQSDLIRDVEIKFTNTQSMNWKIALIVTLNRPMAMPGELALWLDKYVDILHNNVLKNLPDLNKEELFNRAIEMRKRGWV
jgi:hypothetical protein